jgi:hypothetical protein
MAPTDAYVTQAIREDRHILRDLNANLLALDESAFKSDHNPTHVTMMRHDFLTRSQHAARILWRVRGFLRHQRGLPEDDTPPRKVTRTIPPSDLYDPDTPPKIPPYDPTQVEELPR